MRLSSASRALELDPGRALVPGGLQSDVPGGGQADEEVLS